VDNPQIQEVNSNQGENPLDQNIIEEEILAFKPIERSLNEDELNEEIDKLNVDLNHQFLNISEEKSFEEESSNLGKRHIEFGYDSVNISLDEKHIEPELMKKYKKDEVEKQC